MSKQKFKPLDSGEFSKLPGPLFALLQHYDRENTFFRKVSRLIDSFEWAIKWHTVLAMSDLFRSADIPVEIKVLLSSGLRTPSLGTWNLFFRKALKAVQDSIAPWKEWERLGTLEDKHHIVSFRNDYAHGATPDEEDCEKDCEHFYPVLLMLIGSPIFTNVGLAVSGPEGVFQLKGPEKTPLDVDLLRDHAAAVIGGQLLDLWPLGAYALVPESKCEEDWIFFYFNALKSNKVEQLNYECSLKLWDHTLWEPFHARLPLREWGKIKTPEADVFRPRVEALTASFKGRRDERERLEKFCIGGQGTLLVTGVPGIGKSALLAQVFKEIKAGMDIDGNLLENKYPPVIEYFIRCGTKTDSAVHFLTHLNKRLDILFDLKSIAVGDSEMEMSENLSTRLNAIQDKDKNLRLVFFIDGLDETKTDDRVSISRCIPEDRPWLAVVCAGRRGKTVDNFYDSRNIEQSEKMEVAPLGKKDIRAMLYDVTDKYDPEFTKEYIEAVSKRSQGNPLYLKLICDQVFAGGQRIGDIEALPRKIGELFKKAINRVTEGGNNQSALNLLYLLTEAKGSLKVLAIAEFLELNAIQAKSTVDACRELLFEDPLASETEDFQLFHESLREWFKKNSPDECREMSARIADRCFAWQKIKNEHACIYALEHAADHLFDLNDHERLWQLLQDESYRKTQISITNLYKASYHSLQKGIDLYVKRNGQTPEDDARLCWLPLRAGELGHQAKTDINVVFDWAQNRPFDDRRRVVDAFQGLAFLDEEDLYKAVILLLWIEADRQGELQTEERRIEYAQDIIGAFEEKAMKKGWKIDWSELLFPEFVCWFSVHLISVWPNLDLSSLVGKNCVLMALAVVLAEKGDVPSAIEVFNEAQAIDVKAERHVRDYFLTKFAGVLSDEEEYEKASSMINQIEDNSMKADATINITELLARAGEFQQALHFSSDIESYHDEVKALEHITQKMITEQGLDRVLAFAGEVENDFEQCIIINEIARETAKCCDIKSARFLFNRNLKTARGIEDDTEKSIALYIMALTLADAGEFEKAVSLCREIKDDFYIIMGLSDIASHMTANGDPGSAGNLLSEALARSHNMKNKTISKFRLLSYIARIMALAGKTDSADDVFRKALDLSHYVSRKEDLVLSVLVDQAKSGQVFAVDGERNLVFAILEEMKSDYDRSKTICMIAPLLAGAEDLKRLLNITEKMNDEIFTREVLTSIAIASARIGDMKTVKDILMGPLFIAYNRRTLIRKGKDLFNYSYTLKSLSHIACAVSQLGDSELARDAFRQTLISHEITEDPYPKVCSFSDMALEMARNGNMELSHKLIWKALETSMEAGCSLGYILDCLPDMGDMELSRNIYRTVLTALMEKGQLDDYLIRELAERLAGLKDVEFAETMLREILTALPVIQENEPDSGKNSGLMKVIEWFDRWDCLGKLSEVKARAGKYQQALEISREIKNNQTNNQKKTEALVSVARALFESGDTSKAERVFQDALADALDMEDPIDKYSSLQIVLTGFTEIGEFQKAFNVLKQNDNKNSVVLPIMVLCNLAQGLAQAGEVEKALSTARWFCFTGEEDHALSLMLSYLIRGLARRCSFEEALEIASDINDNAPKSQALTAVAVAMFQTGKAERAREVFQQALDENCGDIGGLDELLETGDEVRILRKLIENSGLSGTDRKDLPVDKNSLTPDEALPYIRERVWNSSFDIDGIYSGVRKLHSAVLKAGKLKAFYSIIRQCPQLGLDFLLEGTKPNQTYNNLEEWIDDVENEAAQGKVMVWERQVKNGKMTPKEFNKEIQELLE